MITDFGSKTPSEKQIMILIVKNRSFISRKAEKSDSILKKMEKSEICEVP